MVNSQHLRLTGDKKKALKRQVKSWKLNKNIGAFELFIALYLSTDVINKHLQIIEEEPKPPDWKTHKISWAKHIARIRDQAEWADSLEGKLDDVESGKGYMSEEHHKELMKEQLAASQQLHRNLSEDVRKWKKKAEDEELSKNSKIAKLLKKIKLLESDAGKFCPKCNPIEE